MSTEKDPSQEFPEVHWNELRTRMEGFGAGAVIEFINGMDTLGQRLNLYGFAQRAFGGRDCQGKNLDAIAEVVQAGIAVTLEAAADGDDAERGSQITDFANVLSYNLSADLAECWPGDPLPHEPRHFEAGLRAAEDCLRWREELGKGDYPFASAHWARGMHLLSLGRADEAVTSMEAAVERAASLAKSEGAPPEVEPEGNFMVNLNSGYLGIARASAGDEAGRDLFQRACDAFEKTTGEGAEDAKFGLEQLRYVGGRFLEQ
ncbi:MAG: hypothetical protein CME06_00595 [Gemmatimonadetes bacterium]|nr:hypothetical protein [Gemmatimonadota bacterium]